MKINLIAFLILVVVSFSCRKEYASFTQSSVQKKARVLEQDTTSSDNDQAVLVDSKMEEEIIQTHVVKEKTVLNRKSIQQKELAPNKIIIFSRLKKEISKRERVKKERDPRLSRALWLAIPGGLAVVLGILLYGVAPTGLLIFAFSIVFLVGLVSLIQYWINPKPKM